MDGGGCELQQISRTRTLVATPAPAPRLPVRFAGSRALVPVTRAWVLHRKFIVRVTSALLLAVVLAGAFQARGGIISTAQMVGDLFSGRFAAAGFGVSQIAISGQVLTSEQDVLEALAITPDTTIFEFDAKAARARLAELPAIGEVAVRKIYPDRLIVEISEVDPVARWRVDGVTFVVDGAGNQIGEALPADETLPLVIGDGAADDAMVMIRALNRHPDLEIGLAALSRIADRRWDIIYKTGLRVRLPEMGMAQALNVLEGQQIAHRLLDRDLDLIDLRAPGFMALRPTQREEEDDS